MASELYKDNINVYCGKIECVNQGHQLGRAKGGAVPCLLPTRTAMLPPRATIFNLFYLITPIQVQLYHKNTHKKTNFFSIFVHIGNPPLPPPQEKAEMMPQIIFYFCSSKNKAEYLLHLFSIALHRQNNYTKTLSSI